MFPSENSNVILEFLLSRGNHPSTVTQRASRINDPTGASDVAGKGCVEPHLFLKQPDIKVAGITGLVRGFTWENCPAPV